MTRGRSERPAGKLRMVSGDDEQSISCAASSCRPPSPPLNSRSRLSYDDRFAHRLQTSHEFFCRLELVTAAPLPLIGLLTQTMRTQTLTKTKTLLLFSRLFDRFSATENFHRKCASSPPPPPPPRLLTSLYSLFSQRLFASLSEINAYCLEF